MNFNSTGEIIWEGQSPAVVSIDTTQPREIAAFAKQLSEREKRQVLTAYQAGSYEMATTFVWGRAMAALKRELGTLGISFLAEVLGRLDIKDDDNVQDVVSDREAITLAQDLGLISRTDAIRLRHSQELVAHFSQRDSSEDEDEMLSTEAINVLHSCVKGILAKERIEVATQFAEFRKGLESSTFEANSEKVNALVGSPYFFRRLAVSVLLSGIKTNTGAKLEHCISNLVLLLPLIWNDLRDSERWQVGTTYAQTYADGLKKQTAGLREALLTVKGFDYVPENLRSQVFIKAAEALLAAHEGMNNFHAEEAPARTLEKLGTVLPAPAVGVCFTSLICCYLGNRYGTSWTAAPIAERLLRRQSPDRWKYYFDKVFPGDMRVIDKLTDNATLIRWVELAKRVIPEDLEPASRDVKSILVAAREGNKFAVEKIASRLYLAYYHPAHGKPRS